METEGNHEMESIPFIKSPFQSYNARWKMPYAESGFTSNLYYPFEVAGVHVIMLGSYTDYGEYSDQYAWLKAEFGCPYGFPTKVQKTDVVNADELEYNERVDDSVSKHQVIRLLFAYDSRLTFRLSGTGPEGVTIRLYIEQYVNNSSRIRGTHRKPLHVLILKPAFKVFDPGICFHLTSILSIESRPESSSFYARGE
ncbi:uncharacterized protein LOC110104574 [Dendrobium catenatum]|uniref:Purple acid phosphatase 18 n=1 Tax=Dendrobium catenatum TaxID=906689 RepID=A0A2I0WR01_9ASPA|nr:uncharacterized protein LOC110104574 [Dendrobium catenatum]PKU78095.1 Purple acid phosphatase 18 [Dendrobium catenatum]